jgi:pyruvate/2-oxoglutarate dehydrogenase complex dihydrolipoamide dehydrogenase (E3) component
VNENYDAIVIGTGQAGPALAVRLAGSGQRVAIIERDRFGGTCVNTGCIPTKTLVASAYAAHMARRASEFGVQPGGAVTVDMQRVKARKDEISGKSSTGVETWLRGTQNCTVYQGHARFESSTEVRVDERLLTANRIFINVGGRATIPPLAGVADTPYLTNATLLDLDTLPPHLDSRGRVFGTGVRADFQTLRQRSHNHRESAASDRG